MAEHRNEDFKSENLTPLLTRRNADIEPNNAVICKNLNVNRILKPEKSTDSIDSYDKLMEKVGYNDSFQKIYTLIFIICLTIFNVMIFMNIILALNIPEHWCFVPGRENTNFTINEWRTLTLPSEINEHGEVTHSSCTMYNRSYDILNEINSNLCNETIRCTNGYEFDTEWYTETIASKENWICEEKLKIPTILVVGRMAACIGTIVVGHFSDLYGRKFTYYVTIIATLFFRTLMIFLTSSYIWFLVAVGISSFTVNAILHSTIIIGLEITSEKFRTHLTMLQSVGWAIGASFIPFLFWWIKHWFTFMWVSTIPLALIIICYKFMIESPRWLISKKLFSRAHEELTKIARINRRNFTLSKEDLSKMFDHVKIESTYGLVSLFSNYNLAKTTILTAINWMALGATYFTLILLPKTIVGNPFVNFILPSVFEIPGYLLGSYISDKFGRKITNSASLLTAGLLTIPILFIIPEPKYHHLIVIMVGLLRLFHGAAYVAVGQRTMEIYPTCLRQVGFSFGATLGSIGAISGPHIVYLGVNFGTQMSYYIVGCIYIIGGIAAIFLPETLHKKLPDTMSDINLN